MESQAQFKGRAPDIRIPQPITQNPIGRLYLLIADCFTTMSDQILLLAFGSGLNLLRSFSLGKSWLTGKGYSLTEKGIGVGGILKAWHITAGVWR